MNNNEILNEYFIWEENNSTEPKMKLENKTESEQKDSMTNTKIMNEQENLNVTIQIKSGIYKIINKIDGKYYVGSSKNINIRWYNHIKDLKENKHYNDFLQRAWNKFGSDNFEFVIIELVNDKTKLLLIEQTYLNKAKLEQQCTYNLNWQAKGGDISEYSRLKLKNRHFSEEHSKKISESKIGKPRSKETKEKIKIANTGKKHTMETRSKISNSHIGKIISDKTKLKFREKMLVQLKSGNINNIGSNNVGARPVKVTFIDGRIETFDCIKYLNDKYPLKKYNNIHKLIKKEINRIKDIIKVEYI